MVHIPMVKPIIGDEEKSAIIEVMNSGMIAQGKKTEELEEKFAKLCGTKYAVAVNSGTSALHTAVHSAGIRPGDEVITTPFTFVATANSILMAGAVPVFADIDEETFNISPEEVKKKITKKTRAIMPVDLYGHPYDYRAVREISEKYNLRIIEDAAQAVNAELNGKKAGALGDIGTFSFYATKNIMCGEGGMLVTDNEKFAEESRIFRNHGQTGKYQYGELGFNYRIMDLQAAILLEQLKRVDWITERRMENAKLLTKGLDGVKGIYTPVIRNSAKHVFHQYTVKVDGFRLSRDELMAHLKNKGIDCTVYYPEPLFAYSHLKRYKNGNFPVAEKVCTQVLSLPVHPSLKREDLNYIIKTISDI